MIRPVAFATRSIMATVALASATAMTPVEAARATKSVQAETKVEARRPNIVIILADDLGVEGIGAYGGEYRTPNIDALARDGVRFENAHATPLCTPTRTRLLTGRENAKNYKAFGYLDPKERTFAHAFKEAGYRTGIVGKWQLGGNGFDGLQGAMPDQAGFDDSLLWQVKNQGKGSRYWGPTLVENGRQKVNEWGFGPDYQNAWALDFIEKNKAQPFLLFYSIVLPHSPFVPTPDSMTADNPKVRYAGMIQYLDKLVGSVRAKLTEQGLEKDTMILFAGDNGTARAMSAQRNGATVQGGKGLPILTGTHVPMILNWQGQLPAGATRAGLFDIMDVFPTIAGVAGVKLPQGTVDGVDQWPVAIGKQRTARESIFMHYAPVWVQKPARFAFNERWKLYGDGTFARLDPSTGTETPVAAEALPEDAKASRKMLQNVLDTANDGPLDQTRFPMCAGLPSLKPDLPSTIAGCALDLSGGNE